MSDTAVKSAHPFQETEPSRFRVSGRHLPADGVYRVLATLDIGVSSYRVFGELLVDGGHTELRIYRFEVPAQDAWFAERKINLPVAESEITPVEHKVQGVEFVLCTPVRLDDAKASAVFGSAGPLQM